MSLFNDYQMILERPITEYKTVYSDHSASLDEQVNALIARGWQPFGNPYGPDLCYQAMVKRGNNQEESE